MADFYYIEAGKRIRQIRGERGYTRKHLAEMVSVSTKFLYEIENGKKGFSAKILYNICIALNVDSNYILTGEEKLHAWKEAEEL